MTVAAESTIDQTNRKNEFLKLDLGDVASLFMVYHATMLGFETTHIAQTTCVAFLHL